MNDLFHALGIEGWKPLVGALILPPIPFLLLILVGARLMFRRRLLAWALIFPSVLSIYLVCTPAIGGLLTHGLLQPPPVLSPARIAELKRAPKTAIVILGGGRKLLAPEYGVSDLKPNTHERLRFGLWLARETGLPVAFSGGVGHGSQAGPSEAEIAARIAEREYRQPLRWTEGRSRDTAENGLRSVELLSEAGVERIVLVTHQYHMPRAVAAFARASERTGRRIEVTPAPMGALGRGWPTIAADWMPSVDGFQMTRFALHEWIGRLAGA